MALGGRVPCRFVLQPRPKVVAGDMSLSRRHPATISSSGRFVTVYAIPEPDPPEGPGDTLGTTRAPAVLRLR